MAPILLNIVLAVAWAATSGALTLPNLLFGYVLGAVALTLVRRGGGLRRTFAALDLFIVFLWELAKSTKDVIAIVLSGRALSPAIVAFPLKVRTDAEIALLANLITLTPGTLSLDVSADRKVLFVHAIDAPDPDAVVASIHRSFELRVARVFAP